MTWADVALKALTIIEPYSIFAVPLFFLWLLMKITDQSLRGVISDVMNEFGNLLQRKMNAKSLNALGVILLFALIVFLFFGGLNHLAMPEKHGAGHVTSDIATKGLYVTVLLVFGGVFILSIKLTKYMR